MKRRAFTLVELIAVLVVLSILAGIAVPRYFDRAQKARDAVYDNTVASVGTGLRGLIAARETGLNVPNIEYNEYDVPEHLGDTQANEATLFDAVLDRPYRAAGQGEIGFRYHAGFSNSVIELYYWDANANGSFEFAFGQSSDRYLIYIKQPIGNFYRAGTLLEIAPDRS